MELAPALAAAAAASWASSVAPARGAAPSASRQPEPACAPGASYCPMKALVLPLRQYEVALRHAQQAMSGLLEQPARPWVCFPALVHRLGEQALEMRRRAAACRIQRAFRVGHCRRELEAAVAETLAAERAASRPSAPTAQQKLQAARRPVSPPRSRQIAVADDAGRPLPMPAPLVAALGPAAACAPGAPGAPGAAMNPIEKRRQKIAYQLAAVNPSRLARSRRREMLAGRPLVGGSGLSGAGGSPSGGYGGPGLGAATMPLPQAAEEAACDAAGATPSPLRAATAPAPSLVRQAPKEAVLKDSTTPSRCASPRLRQVVLEPMQHLLERSTPSPSHAGLPSLGMCCKDPPYNEADPLDQLEVVCGAGMSMGAGLSMAPPAYAPLAPQRRADAPALPAPTRPPRAFAPSP